VIVRAVQLQLQEYRSEIILLLAMNRIIDSGNYAVNTVVLHRVASFNVWFISDELL
jgi:hypothetical protein